MARGRAAPILALFTGEAACHDISAIPDHNPDAVRGAA
jgi:hypothetical protein